MPKKAKKGATKPAKAEKHSKKHEAQRAAPKPKRKIKKKHVYFGGGAVVIIGLLIITSFLINQAVSGPEGSTALADGIQDGYTVQVNYVGRLEDGSVFDTSYESVAVEEGLYNELRDYEPLEFEIGAGSMIAGFEDAVRGMEVGERDTVTIPPEKAYGEYDPQKVIGVPLEDLDQEFTVGQMVSTPVGVCTVSEMNGTHLSIDCNPPLAGKTLIFEIELVSAEAPPSFDTPNVKMFVMSFCPYGTQAEEMAYPVQKELGGDVEFDIHFVIYGPAQYAGRESQYCIEDVCAMHGIPELTENMRQACIRDKEPDKVWDYLMCVKQTCSIGDIGTCWETCADENGIDAGQISACEAEDGVSLMQAEKDLNAELGVQGSPTIFLNDREYSWDRTPQSLQRDICNTFVERPAECANTITAAASAADGSC